MVRFSTATACILGCAVASFTSSAAAFQIPSSAAYSAVGCRPMAGRSLVIPPPAQYQ
jgi:hypothetical protein